MSRGCACELRGPYGKPVYDVVLVNTSDAPATFAWRYNSYLDMTSGPCASYETPAPTVTEVEAHSAATLFADCTGMSDQCGFFTGSLTLGDDTREVSVMMWMDPCYQRFEVQPIVERHGWTAEKALVA